jgi:hypothetical protein
MSWGAQNRSKDAKTPSGSRGRSDKPELDRCPVQPYAYPVHAVCHRHGDLSPSIAGLHSNRCVFGHVAACRMQPAVRLHSAYFRGIRSTGLEPPPPPRLWLQGYFPAAQSPKIAHQSRAATGVWRNRGCNRSTNLLLLRRREGESQPRAPLSSACAFFALTHDLVFSAIPAGLRSPCRLE